MLCCLGNVLISGCKHGQVAISNPHTGVVLHMIGEHKGSPITDLSVAKKPPQVTITKSIIIIICCHDVVT